MLLKKMCLTCTYNNYGKCKICSKSTCFKRLWNKTCFKCFCSMQKKRRCRTCKIIFESGNKLFKHLYIMPDCKKDYIPFEFKVCNNWMEKYCLIGFKA